MLGRDLRLPVESEDEEKSERAQAGGGQEGGTHAHRVGEDSARERAHRRGHDLAGLDQPHCAAGLLSRGLGGGHGEAERAEGAEGADARPQDEQLLDPRDRGAQGEKHDVHGERQGGNALVAPAVGEASPGRGEEAGQERRDPDEHAGPQGGLLGLLHPELLDVQGKEGNGEGGAGEDGEHHRHRHELIAAADGLPLHPRSHTSPRARGPRTSSRVRVRPLEPRSRATSAARARSRT